MTLLTDLIAARDGAASRLKDAMTDTTAAGYNPDLSGAGPTVQNDALCSRLLKVIESLNAQIAIEQRNSDGVVNVETIGLI